MYAVVYGYSSTWSIKKYKSLLGDVCHWLRKKIEFFTGLSWALSIFRLEQEKSQVFPLLVVNCDQAGCHIQCLQYVVSMKAVLYLLQVARLEFQSLTFIYCVSENKHSIIERWYAISIHYFVFSLNIKLEHSDWAVQIKLIP